MENFVKAHCQRDLIGPVFTSLAATWQHITLDRHRMQQKFSSRLHQADSTLALKRMANFIQPLCRLTLRGILASNLKTEKSKMHTKMLPKLGLSCGFFSQRAT